MGLIEEKIKLINPYFQLVKFNMKGKVLDSTEEIKSLHNQENIIDSIPFLASIQDVLAKQKVNSDISFHCIQSDFFGIGEYYDFQFKKESKDVISWLICDYTEQYLKTIELQQERNTGVIEQERILKNHENDLKALQKKNDTEHIFLKIDSLLVRLKLRDIGYVEAYGDYIKLHTAEKTHISYAKLKNIEELLPSGKFIRIHRSYIINIDKIETMNQQNVQVGEKILPISLTYKEDLLNKIQKLN